MSRESTQKSRRVSRLAGLPERIGSEMPTGWHFKQALGQSRAVMVDSCRNLPMGWMSLYGLGRGYALL